MRSARVKHDSFAFRKVIVALVLLLLMFKYCLLGRTTGALEMVGNRYKFAGFGGVIVIRLWFWWWWWWWASPCGFVDEAALVVFHNHSQHSSSSSSSVGKFVFQIGAVVSPNGRPRFLIIFFFLVLYLYISSMIFLCFSAIIFSTFSSNHFMLPRRFMEITKKQWPKILFLSLSAWMTRIIMINKDSPSSSGSPMIILRMMTRKGHSSSYKKNSYSSHVAVEEGFWKGFAG